MKRFIICMVSAGILVGAWTRWHFSSFRWSPLGLRSIPQPNQEDKFQFWAASGHFRIEANLPMSVTRKGIGEPVAMPDLPPIPCRLRINIRNGQRFIGTTEIDSLRHIGEYGFGHIDLFDAGTIVLPRFGHYELDIVNLDEKSLISAGTFDLDRKENPADAAVANLFFYFLSFLLLGIGFLAMIYRSVRRSARKQINVF